MINKNFPTLEVGSEVYVASCGALRKHKILSFRIRNSSGELKCEIETEMGKERAIQKMSLDTFLKGIEKAQDMKISDIVD
jgi:hypothetical protein